MPNRPSTASGTRPYRRSLARLRLPRFADRQPNRPFIVAIEGPNGAGKTTLCGALARSLGVPSCLGTDKAWFTPGFKARMIRDAEWYASAMFFMSGCFEQMRVLRGRPEALLIMDRCLWSTLAVHAAENPARLTALIAMLRPIASHLQVPDLTIVLDASFATCQSRIAKKSGDARVLDRLTATPIFHANERGFYSWLGLQLPKLDFLDVDEPTARQVAAKARALIDERLPC